MIRTMLSILIVALLATSALADPYMVVPASAIGGNTPAAMPLTNKGFQMPRAQSWVVSRAFMPVTTPFPENPSLKITVYFTCFDDEAGDVDLKVGLKPLTEGDILNAGSYTANADAPISVVDGEYRVYKQVLYRTIYGHPEDMLIVSVARNTLGGTDTYPGSVGILKIVIEPDDVSAVNDDTPLLRVSGLKTSPNPFNPSTVVSFNLPQAAEVNLNIYDPRGRLVETLVDGEVMGAGQHSLDFAPRQVASGVYMVMLAVEDELMMQKITLLK